MGSPDVAEDAREAAARELPPLLVREPLEAWLDRRELGSGPLAAERIGEGHSNVTFLLRRGAERFVLRRPPRPPLPPSAHDVLREARLLEALAGTPARVPRVLAACGEPSPIGAPFYLMEEVRGGVITTRLPAALDAPVERARIGRELIEALAEVHAVEPHAHGLDGFGRPSGYLERQLRRFGGLWRHNRTRELPRVEQVGDWLTANLPASPPATVVHGDYRLGNVMFAAAAPAELVAIFDWELATIGDPLADLGYLIATWVEPGDPNDHVFRQLTAVTRAEGFPRRDELVALYEEATGRSASDLRWYQALALWKAAVFMEGNLKRSLAGTTDDPFLAQFAEGVPQLAEAAWRATYA